MKLYLLSFLLILFFIIGCQKQNCQLDADCVPATCCHATAAVPKNLAPECENNICTQECVPNTLDCGQGEIRCLENNCQIVLK